MFSLHFVGMSPALKEHKVKEGCRISVLSKWGQWETLISLIDTNLSCSVISDEERRRRAVRWKGQYP